MRRIIGYPRCGNHFLNCALEVYTGKTRLFEIDAQRTYSNLLTLAPAGAEVRWIQSHGNDKVIPTEPFIYLIRDPTDVFYSYWSMRKGSDCSMFIEKYVPEYRDNLLHFGLQENATVISHDALVNDFSRALSKALGVLGFEFDLDRAKYAQSVVTKAAVMAACPSKLWLYFYPAMLTDSYAAQRLVFRKHWKSAIDAICGAAFSRVGQRWS